MFLATYPWPITLERAQNIMHMYFSPMYPLVEDMSKIYARPLPRVYAIFLFAIEQPEPWLTTQWQTEK